MIYIFEDRAFVLAELKKSVIAACGGYTVGMWLTWEDNPLWKTVEAIELVSMLQATDK